MNDPQTMQLIIFGLLIALMLFMMWRGRQRQQAAQQMQRKLGPGDEVMLTSGIYGTIVDLDNERARLQVADGVVLSVHRGALGKLVTDTAPRSDTPPPADGDSHSSGGTTAGS